MMTLGQLDKLRALNTAERERREEVKADVTEADREQSSRLVDLAWAEYVRGIGQPFVEPTPELRQAMLWLAWQSCRIEREAQEAVRNVAIEGEREACAKIADDLEFKQAFCYWQAVADEIGDQIRARTVNPP